MVLYTKSNNVVYTIIFSTNTGTRAYIGARQNAIKSRIAIHKNSSRNKDESISTGLSKYIWSIEEITLITTLYGNIRTSHNL